MTDFDYIHFTKYLEQGISQAIFSAIEEGLSEDRHVEQMAATIAAGLCVLVPTEHIQAVDNLAPASLAVAREIVRLNRQTEDA